MQKREPAWKCIILFIISVAPLRQITVEVCQKSFKLELNDVKNEISTSSL